MSIQAIEQLTLAATPATSAAGGGHPGTGFADMLVQGATATDASIQAAEGKLAAFAAGENVPPHQVMMALEDARMSFQLALQVRSKLVEGVQELMRMQL